MATGELRIEGKVHWEMNHFLPVFWPWLFDPHALTESRRLHTTLLEAGDRFEQHRRRLAPLPYFQALADLFDDLRVDRFPRAIGEQPDAVLSLDLAELEGQRPYRHEVATERWGSFFEAVDRADQKAAVERWNEAILNPLHLYGGQQNDARGLAARALELGLSRESRAAALAIYLFGHPVSRAAKAMHHGVVERAQELPAVAFVAKPSLWKATIGLMRPPRKPPE